MTSKLELSDDGKALNYFEVTDFNLTLNALAIHAATATLTATSTKPDL